MTDLNRPESTEFINRRINSRREEDYFWLARMGDLAHQAVMVINKDLDLEFYNDRAMKLFELPDTVFSAYPSYSEFMKILATRGDFGAGEPEKFCALMEDVVTNQISTATTEPAIVHTNSPSGRRLRISQSYGRDNRIMITAKDVTLETQQQRALDTALKMGRAGYGVYNFETNSFDIFGDHLHTNFNIRNISADNPNAIWSLVHPDDSDRLQAAWKKGVETKTDWETTVRVLDKNKNSIWVHFTGQPEVSEKTGKLISYTLFFRDITETLRSQDEQLKARETAESALKAKNDFLARLSHEVRTPMNAVIGIADALIHHHANPAINPKLELIQSSAEKIVRIVDETLQHTKLDADKLILDPKPSNPGESISNVCRLWEQQALKNGTTLTFQIDKDVPGQINFDSFRYEQCLNNLLSNAVKFTQNGKIRVLLTLVQKTGKTPQLVLAVQDTGIGISKEQQVQIFEAYTQADKSISQRYGGTGLGMSITKQIIELMGGTISVRSAPGKGTVFALSLPVEDLSEIGEEEASDFLLTQIFDKVEPDENSTYSGLNILVADDNATNHMVIKSLLETVVGQIHVANDGEEAIKILKTTPIDVVFMDIHMPVMDGIEATLTIRGSDQPWSNVMIIALTADPQYQQKRLCKNIGMDDALAKPVKLSGILQAIDNVIDSRNTPQDQLLSA